VSAGFIQKLRVLQLITRLNIGGPAVYVVTLCSHLPTDRYLPLLVSGQLAPGEGDMSYLVSGIKFQKISIPFFERNISVLNEIKTFLMIVKIVRRFRPHIIHTHTAKAGAMGRLAAICMRFCRPCGKNIRMVHTFHGHIFSAYFHPVVTQIFILIEKLLALSTDKIIVLSKNQKKDICQKYKIAKSQKVEVVPLGLDLNFLKKIRNEEGASFCKKYLDGLSQKPYMIGIVGRLAPVKNHIMLIQAITHLNEQNKIMDFLFLIVGDGELRGYLEKKVELLGLKEKVVFTGWQRNIKSVYAVLDAMVLTSVNEGTPVTIIEAMAAKIPVIATNVGGIPDMFGKITRSDSGGIQFAERGIMVPTNQPQALARALILLKGSPEISKTMTDLAQKFVFKNYGMKNHMEKIQKIYEG